MKKIFLLIIVTFYSLSYSFAQNKKKLIKEGNKLYNDSSFNLAEMKYRKSLEKDQDYFSASFNLADAVYKQERYQESSSFFEALKNNTKNNKELAIVNHNLGNSLFKENKLDQAIEAYKNSLRQNPNDEETRYNLAYAQKMKQKKDEQEEKQDEKKQDKQEEKQDEMSKEDAKKMLDALQQKEKELQEKLQKKKTKGQKIKILKDW